MSIIPPHDPASAGTSRPIGSGAPAAAQVIVQQQPTSAFGRYGRFLIIALVICIAVIMGQSASYKSYFNPPGGPLERYHSLSEQADKKIAIVRIEGAILDADGFVKQQIDRVRHDPDVVAMVLRIDSPGGTVTASDYLYHHLRELARERELPIVVSMGGLCASGGYYLAMASGGANEDVIFAEPTTWTGSIGVLIPHYDLSGLLARWDVSDDSVASHKDKLMGSPTRLLTPEEKAEERKLLQELVDRSFERFKKVVTDARPKLKDDAEALAEATTGQIFTSEQALELGLVDKIGFVDEAIERAAELAGRDSTSLRCVRYDEPPTLLESLAGVKSPLAPAGRAELSTLLELSAPRAYYLCTWLPSLLGNSR
jgi:protease-4